MSLKLINSLAGAMAAILLSCTVAKANNNLFLPGDAFFYIEADSALRTRMRCFGEGELLVEYGTMTSYPKSLSGYAGYRKLRFGGGSKQLVRNLGAASDFIANRSPRKYARVKVRDDRLDRVELNPVRIFIVNEKYDLTTYQVGNRFNESWVEEALKFGKYVQLCNFIGTPDAIEESWRASNTVKGLKVELPTVTPVEGHAIDTPIEVGGHLAGIVVGETPLADIIQNMDDFLYVTNDGIFQYFRTESGFERSKWPGVVDE